MPVLLLKDFKGFEDWLRLNGVDVFAPTNEWEIVRFKGPTRVHVAYKNKHGRVTTDKTTSDALMAFLTKKPLTFSFPKTKRYSSYHKEKLALMRRDGMACFYCGLVMSPDEITVEHLVALSEGGSNKLGNMCLCHEECNGLAGRLPVIEKMALRDRMRNW